MPKGLIETAVVPLSAKLPVTGDQVVRAPRGRVGGEIEQGRGAVGQAQGWAVSMLPALPKVVLFPGAMYAPEFSVTVFVAADRAAPGQRRSGCDGIGAAAAGGFH